IYNDTWTNKTAIAQTVTYAVIPGITAGCTGDQENIIVTINPEPDLNDLNTTVCSDDITGVTLSDVHGLADSYEITDIVATGGLTGGAGNATTGAGQAASAILNDTWTNATGAVQTVTYSVIPRIAGGCIGDEEDIIVTVNPATFVSIDQDDYYVAAGDIVTISGSITGGTTDGTWSVVSAPVEGTFGNTDFNNATASSTTFDPTDLQDDNGSVVIRLTSDDPDGAGPCQPVWYEATIHIGALPQADAGPDVEDCEPADGLIYISGWAKGAASDAVWSVVTGNGSIISQTTTWSNPQSAPHDQLDSLLVEAVYELDVSDYGTPSTSSVFSFELTTDDPDGVGPVIASTDVMNYTVRWRPATPAIGGGGLGAMCEGANGQFYSVPLTPGNTYVWEVEVLTGGGVEGVDYVIAGGGTGFNFIAIDWISIGTYNLKVTEITYLSDGITPCAGEPVIKPIAIYSAPVVVIAADQTICLGETFNLSSNVTDGTGTYLYEWTPTTGLSDYDVADPTVTGTFLGDIDYSLKVTDVVSGCVSFSNTITITTNPLPNTYTLSGPSFYCDGATTGVTLTLSGSEADVLYQLMNGGTPVGGALTGTGAALTWTDNYAGSYYVEAVRNATPACAQTMAGVVDVTANPAITLNVDEIVDVTCFGDDDGRIRITAGGGTAPYTYLWSGPAAFSSTNEDITGLYAGDYTVTIIDARGCTFDSPVITVDQPDELALISVLETQPVTCYGGSDGEAEVVVDATTGTAPYNYQWFYDASLSTPVAGATTSILTGVPAGTYYILVTDANMCIVSSSVTITQPAQITGSTAITSPVSCNGDSDAEITITAS
ncbi:MAG: SprB repeat-containing protein, partial [Actinobacteria bacterium]|nr:SprB repeat-containing protein [Actinomycetota bacterium]